jgi:succinoglycan biosynthesis transport protein ExoP
VEADVLSEPRGPDTARAAKRSFAVELRRFGSLLKERKWTIVLVTAAVLGTALLLSFRQTPSYSSQATVLVQVPPGESAPDGPNMATEKRIASSAAVAELVQARLQLPEERPETLLRDLSVEVPVDTEILTFAYSAPVPEMAQQRAEMFAKAYLDYRQQRLGDDVLASQRSLQAQINSLNGRLAVLQKRAATQRSDVDKRVLEGQANLLYTQISNLYLKRAELVRAQQAPAGRILADAEVPSAPSRPDHLINGSLGLVLGLMLGLALAVLREYADDHLRGSDDFESQVSMPVLGTIPAITTRHGPPGAEALVTVKQPDSAAAEAFRHLRANFAVAAASSGAKTILVTSAGEGEGKTFTAANLGVVLAKSGCEVVLVSADLRKPHLEQVFGISARLGLVDLLRDRVVPRSISTAEAGTTMWSVMHNLVVLPVGSTDGDLTELVGSSDLTELIQDLRHQVDYVLVDATPLLPVADAAALVPACDAVLMVANARSATRADVLEARQHLERMHATTLGAVLITARDGGPRRYPHRG